ncbi:unnamed protein product [Ixodes persulcatus]
MEPQRTGGDRRCSTMTSTRQTMMAMAAYRGLTTNIMVPQPSRPSSEVCHEKYLNDGLHAQRGQPDSDAKSRARQARLVDR